MWKCGIRTDAASQGGHHQPNRRQRRCDCVISSEWCSATAEEGSLRLVGRVDINGFATGAVQVFHDGAFGAVCVEGFDAAAADVACRQMGFVGGTDIPLTLRGSLAPREQRALIDVRPESLQSAAPVCPHFHRIVSCWTPSMGSPSSVTRVRSSGHRGRWQLQLRDGWPCLHCMHDHASSQ